PEEGHRFRQPDPLVRDAALHAGQRPPHRAQGRRRSRGPGRRARSVHRRLSEEEGTRMIPRHIFREYDIRGLHETELSNETAEAVGRAFGTLIRRERGVRAALGRDVRPSSERLAAAVEKGMLASGIQVERVGVVPTPALYYAVVARGLDGGMQITGSHNPPEFNGFKMTK